MKAGVVVNLEPMAVSFDGVWVLRRWFQAEVERIQPESDSGIVQPRGFGWSAVVSQPTEVPTDGR